MQTMMRKIIVYITGILAAVSFHSCSDFFEPPMTGSVEASTFYTNITNIGAVLNSSFSLMQTEAYQRSELLFGEAMSDNCWNSKDVGSGDITDLLNFTFSTSNTYILERYRLNYQGIYQCNQVISSIPYVKYDTLQPNNLTTLRKWYAQAKVLRAFFYFNLAKTFGGVSIQPENQQIDSFVVARSSLDDTYAYIEKDLREAILNLQTSAYTGSSAGGIDAGAGLGLLMKVLLYEASPGIPLTNTDKAQKWQEALEIGKYLIDGESITVNNLVKFDERYAGKETWDEFLQRLILPSTMQKSDMMPDIHNVHGLNPNFDQLFRVIGEYCIESLIEINHYDYGSITSIDMGWPMNNYINSQTSPESPTVFYSQPTKALCDLYNNDPRGLLTVAAARNINNYFRYDANGTTVEPENWWFNFGDFNQFTKFYTWPSEGTAKMRNYRVFRYAEVLLIYAEVLNETGNPNKAVDVLNRVRSRAANLFKSSSASNPYQTVLSTSFPMQNYAPYDIVRNAILLEKRLEMAGEGDRWFEIMRLGQLPARMAYLALTGPADAIGGPRHRGEYFKRGINEIFPIPQQEVFVSNGVIKQNYGY
jgi:hypothetical protein